MALYAMSIEHNIPRIPTSPRINCLADYVISGRTRRFTDAPPVSFVVVVVLTLAPPKMPPACSHRAWGLLLLIKTFTRNILPRKWNWQNDVRKLITVQKPLFVDRKGWPRSPRIRIYDTSDCPVAAGRTVRESMDGPCGRGQLNSDDRVVGPFARSSQETHPSLSVSSGAPSPRAGVVQPKPSTFQLHVETPVSRVACHLSRWYAGRGWNCQESIPSRSGAPPLTLPTGLLVTHAHVDDVTAEVDCDDRSPEIPSAGAERSSPRAAT